MKIKLIEPQKPAFEPLTLTITIESLGELAVLWARHQESLQDVVHRVRLCRLAAERRQGACGTNFEKFVMDHINVGHFDETMHELRELLRARLGVEYEAQTGLHDAAE